MDTLKDNYIRDDQGHGKSRSALNLIENQGRYYLENDLKEAIAKLNSRTSGHHSDLIKEIFGDFK